MLNMALVSWHVCGSSDLVTKMANKHFDKPEFPPFAIVVIARNFPLEDVPSPQICLIRVREEHYFLKPLQKQIINGSLVIFSSRFISFQQPDLSQVFWSRNRQRHYISHGLVESCPHKFKGFTFKSALTTS